jgi:hypothetical protein
MAAGFGAILAEGAGGGIAGAAAAGAGGGDGLIYLGQYLASCHAEMEAILPAMLSLLAQHRRYRRLPTSECHWQFLHCTPPPI